MLHMVSFAVLHFNCLAEKTGVADIEAEDLELGADTQENLAFDVDDDMDQGEDPEDLESENDEEERLDKELGLDDDTDGM